MGKEKIRPKFNKELPINYIDFFALNSDDEFKAEHPIAYPFLVVIGILAFLMPLGIFLYLLNTFVEKRINLLVALGVIGGLISGIGLFNIAAAYLDQYLGHKVTFYTLATGLLLMFLSFFLMI